MIGTLVLKNSRLKAKNQRFKVEKKQLFRDRKVEGAKAEERVARLMKQKDVAVDFYQRVQGQALDVNATLDRFRYRIGYLEKLLAFEEKPGYFSMRERLQLE